MHKFKIEMSDNGRGEVYMDGARVRGVLKVDFSAGIDQVNQVTLTVIAGEVTIEGVAGVVADATTIEDESRRFAAA